MSILSPGPPLQHIPKGIEVLRVLTLVAILAHIHSLSPILLVSEAVGVEGDIYRE